MFVSHSLLLRGQSGSGKTYMAQQILSKKLFDCEASEVILCVPKNSSHLLEESIQAGTVECS